MNEATATRTIPIGAEQEPAALEDLRERRVEDDRERERRAERQRTARSRPPSEEPEDLDRGEGRDERDGQRPGPARRSPRTISRTGTSTAALIARSRITDATGRSATEAAMAAGELEQGGVERVRTEVRPERVAGVELGVGRLPDQEVGEALLAAGPDDQVRVGQAGGVERAADRGLVDLGRPAMPLAASRRTASTISVRPA